LRVALPEVPVPKTPSIFPNLADPFASMICRECRRLAAPAFTCHFCWIILFSLSTFRYKPEHNSLTLANDTLILLPNKPPDYSHFIDHSPLKLFSAVFKVALFRFVSLLNSSNKEQLSFISICGCSSWK
jgi:hypothetical protein